MPQTKKTNPHHGSDFNDFLAHEAALVPTTAVAIERVMAWLDIPPIRTEADYKAVLRAASLLIETDPEPGTPEGDRLNTLVTLIEAYEREHCLSS